MRTTIIPTKGKWYWIKFTGTENPENHFHGPGMCIVNPCSILPAGIHEFLIEWNGRCQIAKFHQDDIKFPAREGSRVDRRIVNRMLHELTLRLYNMAYWPH